MMSKSALFIRHQAQPGKRDEVRRVWEKYVKPRETCPHHHPDQPRRRCGTPKRFHKKCPEPCRLVRRIGEVTTKTITRLEKSL